MTTKLEARALVARRLAAAPKIEMAPWHNAHHYRVEGQPNPDHVQGLWPSVTTILGAGVPKPGLVGWARNSALAVVRAGLLPMPSSVPDYPEWVDGIIARAKASGDMDVRDYGVAAHALISAWLRDRTVPEQGSLGYESYDAFRLWLPQIDWEVVASELPVFHEGLAGTVDLILYDGGGTWAVADIKTGSGVYPEDAFQAAAYARAVSGMLGIGIQTAAVLHLPRLLQEGQPPFRCHWVKDMAVAYMGFAAAHAMRAALKMDLFATNEAKEENKP